MTGHDLVPGLVGAPACHLADNLLRDLTHDLVCHLVRDLFRRGRPKQNPQSQSCCGLGGPPETAVNAAR